MEKHHDHHDHDHHNNHQHEHANALFWPLVITLGFAFVEATGGWLTGSLALLGDAGHMFSDSASLGLAALGAWIAQKPASARHSFGYVRAEVMVALINGLLMLIVIAFIVYEAIQRLHNPQPVHGAQVMWIASLGLIVNIVVARYLHQHQHNLNARAALLHVMGDLLGSVAALAAGAVIYFTGWMPIDPLLSLFISALILFSTLPLLREVLHVLMEGVPSNIHVEEVTQAMRNVDEVKGVHSVHIWSLSSEMTAISAHIGLENLATWHEVLLNLRRVLHDKFDIDHVTLQPEIVHAEHDLHSSDHSNSGNNACFLTAKH